MLFLKWFYQTSWNFVEESLASVGPGVVWGPNGGWVFTWWKIEQNNLSRKVEIVIESCFVFDCIKQFWSINMAIFVQVDGVALNLLLEFTFTEFTQLYQSCWPLTWYIFKASPVKYRREHLAVRLLNVKDPSGTAKVCLFGDNAEMNFEVNDGVEISGLYRKTYMGKQQLASSRVTTCRVS